MFFTSGRGRERLVCLMCLDLQHLCGKTFLGMDDMIYDSVQVVLHGAKGVCIFGTIV